MEVKLLMKELLRQKHTQFGREELARMPFSFGLFTDAS